MLNLGAQFSEDCIEIFAAINRHYNEIAKYLIEYTSIVYIPGKFSAIFDCLFSNNLEILQFLYDQGVTFNQIHCLEDCLTFACLNSSEEIVQFLIEHV